MDIRNEVLEKADKIGFASCVALSVIVLIATFYLGGYRIAEALYIPPTPVEEKEVFADEPRDILEEGEEMDSSSANHGLANERDSVGDEEQSRQLDDLSGTDGSEPELANDESGDEQETDEPDILERVRPNGDGSQEEQYVEDDQGGMESGREGDSLVRSGGSDVESYSSDEFRYLGEIYDDEFCYKWYSQQVLPGDGLFIPGRYVDDEGYVRDEDGNLCVASNRYPIGTQIEVPFGDGYAVVYDTYEDEEDNLIDVYTDW
jgi:hypothetical protein